MNLRWNKAPTARWKSVRCVTGQPSSVTSSPGLKDTAKLLCAPPGK